jgi:hypothetical protein
MLPDPRIWTCGSRKRSSRCARQRSFTDWASPDLRPGRSRVPAVPGPASTVPGRDWYSAPGRDWARGAAASGASASASAFAAWASCAAVRAYAWVRDPGCASGSGSSVQKGDVASWLKSLLIREKTVTGLVVTSTEAACTCWRPLRIRDMFGVLVGGWLFVVGCWLLTEGGPWTGGARFCVGERWAEAGEGALLFDEAPGPLPSLSPRKGRKRADRREVIPWRGVERSRCQASVPVPIYPPCPSLSREGT